MVITIPGMKRVPSHRKSIVKIDALLAKSASSAALLDALHAMTILDGGKSPTLTELVLAPLRSERGQGCVSWRQFYQNGDRV